jgi:hypothetical protein
LEPLRLSRVVLKGANLHIGLPEITELNVEASHRERERSNNSPSSALDPVDKQDIVPFPPKN